VDASIKISHIKASKVVQGLRSLFFEQSNTTTVTSTTKIANKHPFPISFVSEEIWPTWGDKRIIVTLKKPEELVNTKEHTSDSGREDEVKVQWGSASDKGGEKEAKVESFGTIAAGKEVVLVTEWDIKSPISINLFGDHD
jgi:hypothetical protein